MGVLDLARVAYEKTMAKLTGAGNSSGSDLWRLLRHPRDKTEILALMQRLRETTSLRMIPMYRGWYQEILHFYGEHHMEWNWRSQRLQPTRAPRYVPKSTTNLILPRSMTGIGQLLNVPITGRVHPNDHQKASDVDGAKAAEKIRRYNWIRNDMDDKMEETAFWLQITGNAWVKSLLEAKPKDRVEFEIEQQDPDTGEMVKVPVSMQLADLQREVCGPFEMILDWNALNQGEQYWIVQQRVRSLDWIRDTFGNDAASQVGSEENLGINAWYQFKVRDLLSRASGRLGTGYNQAMGPHSDLTLESSSLVMEWYEIPTDDYPDGKIFITAGGQVLEADKNYYKKIPYEHFRYIRLPGSIYSFGGVRNAIPLIKRLNGLDSQLDLNRKTVNGGCWLNPVRSGFGQGIANGTPGIIHSYDPARTFGHEPKRIPGEPIGGEAFTQREHMLRDIDDVMMVRGGALTGGAPKGVTAGVALKELRDRAREQHLPIRNRFFRSIERMERFGLEIVQMAPAWKTPRAVKVVGTDGEVKVQEFTAADMNGNIDFRVEQGIRRDETQIARRERLQNFAMMGLINLEDPVNRAQFLQEQGLEDYNKEIYLDYQKALRENEAIREGRIVPIPDPENPEEFHVPIGDFDNDQIFIRVHTDMTKLNEFQSWPETAKLTLMIKITAHQKRQAQKERDEMISRLAAAGEGVKDAGNGATGSAAAKPGAQPPSPPSSARVPRTMMESTEV